MLRNLKGLLVLAAMAGAFVAPRAHALFVSGYPCWVSRVPKSNTSIHGNFGYVRFSVYPTSSCVTGTNPAGAVAIPSVLRKSGGMKSHAVIPLGSGMPGVSGS